MSRDVMEYDVVIVGAGPAGLATGIRLKQDYPECRVCILEKGTEVGAHILSGAVFEPTALTELIPDWQEKGAPVTVAVTEDRFLFLNETKHKQMPNWLLPKSLHNHGNYIISLSNLCRWLGEEAQQLGVEIYPGFTAKELIFDDKNRINGIITGDLGIAKDGSHKADYTPGIEIRARYTVLAEGCRGSLSEQVIKHFNLRADKDPQTYGIGIKELWEIDPKHHQPGLVMHTAGWPLDNMTYGGSFIYHLDNHQIAVGFVIGLDYTNPYLDPFKEMQRFKLHPSIKPLFENGKRICYGARALNEGGLQSLPKLVFPGGLLVGCAAGFLNVAKIKGSHNALRSGMLAAQTISIALKLNDDQQLNRYQDAFNHSPIQQELHHSRNFRHYFRFGLTMGTLLAGLDLKLFQGHTPWSLHNNKHDRNQLLTVNQAKPIDYPAPDGKISFDRMSSVYLANTIHDEDQPIHLRVLNLKLELTETRTLYNSPETRYCPAGVYEMTQDEQGNPKLQINAANCVHCKTCDIKDPFDNIRWELPQGGSGPNYSGM